MESELNLLKQENARLMARVKELEQTAKEKEALEVRIAELEHAVEENTQLKVKVTKLEYDFEEFKKRTQTFTNTQEAKIQIPDSSLDYSEPQATFLPIGDHSNKEILSHCETNDSVTSEQIENTSDNASSTPVEWVEPRVSDLTKSLKDKDIDNFLDLNEKERVSNMMRERNREKKLQDQEAIQKISSSSEVQSVISTKINPTTEIKIPYNQKVEQGLIRELSVFINEKSPSNSISDKQISKNMLDEGDLDAKASSLCGTLGSALHLAYLFDKAKKTGQKEILRWYYYCEEFEKKVRDISSKNEINNDQMARTQIYNEMEPYLPGIKREYLRMKTHKARNVYTLFKEIGIDKIKQITYSADAISSLTGVQIRNIINRFPKKNAHVIEPSISNDSEKLPETEISAFPEKVSPEIQVNTSNKACPPISILPNYTSVIFSDNDVEAGYYYDLSSGKPICKESSLEHLHGPISTC
ncbi:10780_t:CDS:1 [Entrophospora sp. SA101]|nr:10780_t:CDS:1 [Entrophospora sp. SA101]